METSVVGIDLSKNIFHMAFLNHRGNVIRRQKVGRHAVLSAVREVGEKALIYMETCQGSHQWCRELRRAGFDARQIPAQAVKKYAKHQKNDYNDAEAIAEAGSRAETRFVPVKSKEQQELEAVMNMRARLIANRIALMNQTRGILLEQGKAIIQGRSALVKYLRSEMADISAFIREPLRHLLSELLGYDEKIAYLDNILIRRAKACPIIRRLMTIPGVGYLTAIALSTASGNAREFRNGRQFAANLGLVPRQHSSGGKTCLLGITKHGDKALRSLLVVGAHAIIRFAVGKKRTDPHSLWIRNLYEKKGGNLTAVALANKNARIAWRILTTPALKFDAALSHQRVSLSGCPENALN
jgi:transposase